MKKLFVLVFIVLSCVSSDKSAQDVIAASSSEKALINPATGFKAGSLEDNIINRYQDLKETLNLLCENELTICLRKIADMQTILDSVQCDLTFSKSLPEKSNQLVVYTGSEYEPILGGAKYYYSKNVTTLIKETVVNARFNNLIILLEELYYKNRAEAIAISNIISRYLTSFAREKNYKQISLKK